MSHNRYFIVNASDTNLDDIIDITVGILATKRTNVDGSKIVVKLYKNDHTNHSVLQTYTEYDHDGILSEISTSEWNDV